jgi:hypothetical protein
MATVPYESKENAGHKFWTARYGRHAIRIDANRHGVYPWLITPGGAHSPPGRRSRPSWGRGGGKRSLG